MRDMMIGIIFLCGIVAAGMCLFPPQATTWGIAGAESVDIAYAPVFSAGRNTTIAWDRLLAELGIPCFMGLGAAVAFKLTVRRA